MTILLHQHPFASYCWKVLIALYEREVPFTALPVNDQADRDRLAEVWPLSGIPVLIDQDAGLVLPESTVIIEYLDRYGEAPPMIPTGQDEALQVRLWDRILDGHVMTPMQKIVGDSLRPAGRGDPEGVREARATLDRAYALIEDRLNDLACMGGEHFTLADCSAAPSLFYGRVVHGWKPHEHPALETYFRKLRSRPSVDRVIEESRYFREFFPLPWPEHVD